MQEPHITALLSGDETMINAYKEGKDLYAVIAQAIYHNKYEENLEFWQAGTELTIDGKKIIAGNKTNLNPDGKARRSVAKMVLLSNYR